MTLANIPDHVLVQVGFGTPLHERNDLYALVHCLSYQLIAVKGNIWGGRTRSKDETADCINALREYADRIGIAPVEGHPTFDTLGAVEQLRSGLRLDLRSLATAMEDGEWGLAKEWETVVYNRVKGLREGLFLLHLATNPEVLR